MQYVTLYTLGHSNRSAGELIRLLETAAIEILVDVRAAPYSRRYPQFAKDSLLSHLHGADIGYAWMGTEFGGRRPAAPASPNIALPDGLRGYADYMMSTEFHHAVIALMAMAQRESLAVMCAERQPEHCHRWLLADYLVTQGARVVHLVTADEQREHVPSTAARNVDGHLIYDRQVTGGLFGD